MSSAPLLADVDVDGKPRKAVAVPSKQSFLYVFDRITGEPVWPIRRDAGAAVRRAGREDLADAAVSDQAAGVRASLRQSARRHHRLHAGAPRRRRWSQLKDLSHPGRCSTRRSSARVEGDSGADHRHAGRWHQLAGCDLRPEMHIVFAPHATPACRRSDWWSRRKDFPTSAIVAGSPGIDAGPGFQAAADGPCSRDARRPAAAQSAEPPLQLRLRRPQGLRRRSRFQRGGGLTCKVCRS